MQREDGTFDIINRADNTYVSPASGNNQALKTSTTAPTVGWEFAEAATYGYYIIRSSDAQFNQTNNATQGYNIYNWGNGTNTTDTGCQYDFTLVDTEGEATGIRRLTGTVKAGAADGLYYDLQGRATTKPDRGVYIRDGHKVIF